MKKLAESGVMLMFSFALAGALCVKSCGGDHAVGGKGLSLHHDPLQQSLTPLAPCLSSSPSLHHGDGVPGGGLWLDDPALLPEAVPAQHGGHRAAALVRLG